MLAAQRATSQPNQTLNVLLDNNPTPVGTITPSSTSYQPLSVQFVVTGGKHTIKLQGAQSADSTVLIDSVAVAPDLKTALAASDGPPLLNAISNQQVDEGSVDSFTAVTDDSIVAPIFSLAPGAPAGAQINPSTGLFTWTPTAPGVYPVTIDATDSSSPSIVDQQTFTITVGQAASTPYVVANLSSPIYGQSLSFGAAVPAVPGLATPTGTIQFILDGANFGQPVSLVNGVAYSPSLTTLGAGVHHEAAVYSGDANYAPVDSSILTTTIAQAPLLVAANNSAKIYGQPNPLLAVSYYGFVNGDTAASLMSPAIVATVVNQLGPVGTYAITVAGASSPNYAITFLPGTLDVLPTPAGATRQLLGDSAFVTTLYEEVLGRNPDLAGFNFWVEVLARGPARRPWRRPSGTRRSTKPCSPRATPRRSRRPSRSRTPRTPDGSPTCSARLCRPARSADSTAI